MLTAEEPRLVGLQDGTGAHRLQAPSVSGQIWVVNIVSMLTIGVLAKLLQEWVLMVKATREK